METGHHGLGTCLFTAFYVSQHITISYWKLRQPINYCQVFVAVINFVLQCQRRRRREVWYSPCLKWRSATCTRLLLSSPRLTPHSNARVSYTGACICACVRSCVSLCVCGGGGRGRGGGGGKAWITLTLFLHDRNLRNVKLWVCFVLFFLFF